MRVDRKRWERSWFPFLWSRWCFAMLSTAPSVCFTCWHEWKFSIATPSETPGPGEKT